MTPVEVSLCAQAITSAAGSATGLGSVAGIGLDQDRVAEERRGGRRLGELLRELAVDEVQGALAHEPGGGGVPEGGRAAVAERHLVAVGQAEELADAGANPADQVLDRLLPVRGAHHRGALGELGQRLGTHLRGPAAEAAVRGLELGGDLRGGRNGHRRRQVID